MQEKTTRNIYNVWSYFYDVFWPSIVHRRTTRAIQRMAIRPGERGAVTLASGRGWP